MISGGVDKAGALEVAADGTARGVGAPRWFRGGPGRRLRALSGARAAGRTQKL
jgi:hypothetical protein